MIVNTMIFKKNRFYRNNINNEPYICPIGSISERCGISCKVT